MKKIDFKKLLVSFSIVSILVLISMILTKNTMSYYEELNKPLLAPPKILFPIVWSILYTILAVTLYKFYDDKNIRMSIIINLVINVIWPILFFRFKLIGISAIWLILIIISLIVTLVKIYRQNKFFVYLNALYFIWLVFALYLNVSIFYLNRG